MTKQQRIEAIEKELALLKAECEAEESNKFWEPTNGEKAWYIDDVLLENPKAIEDFRWSQAEIVLGKAYKTKELAGEALELQLATQRLKKAVWNLNGGEYGWENSRQDWCASLSSNFLVEAEHWYTYKHYPSWFYLKSEELCKQLIKSHKDDLLTYLGA